MSGVLYRIGRACFARRWLVVAAWLVVLVAAGAGMKIGGGQLDNTFTIPGSQSQTALDQVKTDFPAAGGTSAQLVFAARGGTTVTSPANATAISRALSSAAAAPQVAAVISPRQSHLVTRDGTTAIATVQYRVSASDVDSGTLDALSSIAGAADSATLSVRAGGQAFSSVAAGSGGSEVTGLLIAFGVLAVALASLVAAGMPLLTALTGVGVSVLTLHALLAGQIPWRRLFPAGLATAICYTGLGAYIAYVMSSSIVSGQATYGPIGTVITLLAAETGLGVALQLGAAIGATVGRRKGPGGHRPGRSRTPAG